MLQQYQCNPAFLPTAILTVLALGYVCVSLIKKSSLSLVKTPIRANLNSLPDQVPTQIISNSLNDKVGSSFL
jgi:hypothetical protein